MLKKINEYGLYIGLIIALLGMIGSLYFSEVMGLMPCLLCWYQRIAMYPLVVIFAVGILGRSKEAWNYAAAFIFVGFLIGLYQLLLVYGIVPEGAATCAIGIPCALVSWSFGFITIPLLSFIAWIVFGILYFIHKKYK